MGMFHLGQFAIAPLLPLYFIRVANLNDNEIGLLNVGFFIANFFGSVLLVNWLRQMGNRRSLLFGATMMIFFPLVVAQSGGFWALFGAHLGIGLTWGAVATGTQNRVLEQCSEQNRATQLAAYNFVLNGGVLLGPLISSSVAEVNGVVMALWVTAFLRLLGFVGLWRWG
jgi:MFS family permease